MNRCHYSFGVSKCDHTECIDNPALRSSAWEDRARKAEARIAELEAALRDGQLRKREDYFPEIAHYRQRNRDMHDRAQKAEARVAELETFIRGVLKHGAVDEECPHVAALAKLVEPTASVCTCSTDAINMCPACRAAKAALRTETARQEGAETAGFSSALHEVTNAIVFLDRVDDGDPFNSGYRAALRDVQRFVDESTPESTPTGSEER